MTDYSAMSDAELLSLYKQQSSGNPLDQALSAEGVTGKAADFVRSIYQQESGSGRNTRTSNAGAVGGMQIIPDTFASVADKDWSINDPIHNARAGVRYALQGLQAAGGDPALAGAYYYGGPGGLAKAQRGVAVSDPRNPGAPNTLQYGQQVAGRMPKERGLVQRAVEAVIPSAEAAEPSPYASMTDEELIAEYQKAQGTAGVPRVEVTGTSTSPEPQSTAETVGGGLRDVAAGAIRGAGSIGATLMRGAGAVGLPFGDTAAESTQRRADMDAALADITGADTNSWAYGGGKLAGEIAGTAGVGSALAVPAKIAGALAPSIAPAAARVAQALTSGGMTVGQGGNLATNTLLRVAGGAGTGYASAGLVNPADAGTGAIIGGAVPALAAGAGYVGQKIGRAMVGGPVGPEVAKLAQRAEQLGINIPADRIVNSRPLNAVAAGLNYVPFSGRAATEEAMQSQLNTALSKTFGQNSDNVTQALRKAKGDLGAKFDATLKANSVNFDQQLLQDLGDVSARAVKELPPDLAGIINKQVDHITAGGATGQIDGELAYNIKKTLDRISDRNSSEAFYARDLKKRLMSALDRSLSAQEAAKFKTVRQQYGNMLELENLAQNGVDGNVSIARVANMKGLNNPDLQELADIAAQFLKPREGQHGAAQRALAGGTMFGLGGPAGLVTGIGTGRLTNSLLNSGIAHDAVLGLPQTNPLLRLAGNTNLAQLGYRAAPLLGTSQ